MPKTKLVAHNGGVWRLSEKRFIIMCSWLTSDEPINLDKFGTFLGTCETLDALTAERKAAEENSKRVAAIGAEHKLKSFWRCDQALPDDMDQPHPFQGMALFCDGFKALEWPKSLGLIDDADQERSPVMSILGPTWLDLWRSADVLISRLKQSESLDVFIETFKPMADGKTVRLGVGWEMFVGPNGETATTADLEETNEH